MMAGSYDPASSWESLREGGKRVAAGACQPMAREAVLSPKESTGAPMRSSMET